MLIYLYHDVLTCFKNHNKYTKTRLTTEKGRSRAAQQMNFKSAKSLSENFVEVTMNQPGTEKNPIHCGLCVLHLSKVILMKFIMFLHEFLIENSFELIYTG